MLKWIAPLVAVLAGSLFLLGCRAERPPSSVEEAPYQLTVDGTLRIREDLMPMLRFAKVQKSNILAELPGVGDIAFAPGAMVAVRIPFDGIVESVEVFAGQTVAVDQVLARIRSSELAKMRADIRRLTAELGGEYDAVKRASVLVAKEAISNRKVVELEATIGGLEAQRTGLLVALRSARATEEGEDLFELRSPRAGQVIQRKIDPGEHAHDPAHEPAFVVVDPHNLIVNASFPERDAPLLREGFACRIEVPSLGQVCFEGQVRSVVQAIDPTNRTVQVSCGFNSPDRRLRAAMLARVTIVVQGVDLLVVPRESVLLRRDMRVVLVRRGDRELERRPVVVGSSVAATLEISSGLSEGEEIVVEGAVLLDGELDRLL